MTDAGITYHYLVYGRVQGVGFRWFARQLADRYGLTGTVRNLEDGSVEIYATGTKEVLQLFEQKLNEGPSFGLVREVSAQHIATRSFSNFSIVL
ncbi:acylphosphatase [bacterium]|nr:acylphosphatase [bacterium]